MRNKFASVPEAVELVLDADTLCLGGFASHGAPEALLKGLAQRFLDTGHPKGLTLLMGAATGDFTEQYGANHLAHEGLVKRVVGAHFAAAPKLAKMLMESEVEAYNLPLGVITQLYRDMAAGLPGRATPVGLGTFVDPRLEGGKINKHTEEDIVSVVAARRQGDAVLQGDTDLGGLHPRHSGGSRRQHHHGSRVADARHAGDRDGGQQQRRPGDRPGRVRRRRGVVQCAPGQGAGTLVDCVVVAQPDQHLQSLAAPQHNFAYSAEARVPLGQMEPMPMDERKIIARRASFELVPNAVVNLGVGMPEGVAGVANEEKVVKFMTLTTEPGVIGGVPVSGKAFGAALNADAIIDMDRQFDDYDGGGLDLTCLGLAQCDRVATSTSAASDPGSQAPAASSTSRRAREGSCSSAPSRRAASRSRSRRAS